MSVLSDLRGLWRGRDQNKTLCLQHNTTQQSRTGDKIHFFKPRIELLDTAEGR